MRADLFLSQSLETLADRLVQQFSENPIDPLETRRILVPHSPMKQWLFLEIAKRKKVVMGLKVSEVGQLFPPSLNPVQMFCLIYAELSKCTDPALLAYIEGKTKRLLDLTEQLTSLFFTYGEFGKKLFCGKHQEHWQYDLLQKLFVQGPWRLPVQMQRQSSEPIICFGIDFLPPVYWEFLFQAPSLSIYLFSPCAEFWEDLCTARERKNLSRYWQKKGASQKRRTELDTYLRQAPKILANWGKIGRETLQIFDRFDLQGEEIYSSLQPTSLLKQIQSDLLFFRETQNPPIDDSVKIFLTGSSRLKEVECLRDEILRLEVPYHEISVLAPDIEPYVPLIEFVFSELYCDRSSCVNSGGSQSAPDLKDREEGRIASIRSTGSSMTPRHWGGADDRLKMGHYDGPPNSHNLTGRSIIPYRISGFDLAPQSSFRHGLIRLFQLVSGRWSAEEVFTLFETPSFYRRRGWDREKLEQFRALICAAQVQWGRDALHQKEVLTAAFGEKPYQSRGSWEKGLDDLLATFVYFSPLQVDPDLLEELIALLTAIQKIDLQANKTLAAWADQLEAIAQEFFLADPNEEADLATQNAFRQLLFDLRSNEEQKEVPFAVIERFLLRPCPGQIHASHLHAVSFAPFEKGALIPAKALFLIGIDEEHFPRPRSLSSLHLLQGEIPDASDQDRYLFLQALFAAKEYLRISYGHISAEEGKPIGPSLLVQELLGFLPPDVYRSPPISPNPKKWTFAAAATAPSLPKGEILLSISDLRQLARHPWKFFLQKAHGIYLHEELEESFALQKGKQLRASLEKPLEEIQQPAGALGKALQLEIAEKAEQWQKRLAEWGLKPFSLIFRENCAEAGWEGSHYVAPPLTLHWDHLTVRLTGEIQHATLQGLVCTHDDSIAGLLKIWPEALIVALAFQAPKIWMLKNGKIKDLEQTEQSLKLFVEYYFHCLSNPSPLLPDWADAFLRKSAAELEKKIQKGSRFEDPIAEWVSARVLLPTAEEMFESWSVYLRKAFAGLIQLYPTRGKNHAAL